MLIPTTDKWVLVRWHGGVRSVVLRKFLMKHLPPGEQLKISAVVKVATSEAGKPDTATVLTSGNDRHQLDLLSDPGERTSSSDDEQPLPEPDNDKNEDSGEDFEDSASDWTPESPSSEESDSSESDTEKDINKKESKKDTSKSNKSVSKPLPKKGQNAKKPPEPVEDEAENQKTKEVLAKTLERLENLYIGPDRKMDRIKKRREPVKGVNNDKQIKPKPKGKVDNKNMPEVLSYMHTMFASLFQIIAGTDRSIRCPTEFKHVKVGVVAETGDVVIRDKHYYNTIQRINKHTSDYFDKTLTPHETDNASTPEPMEAKQNKKKSQVFDKTLTPHESDDEPLATIVKKNTKIQSKDKETPDLCKTMKTMKLFDNNRTSTPVDSEKLEASSEDESSDCDYSSDRSDDPVMISNKYEIVEPNHNIPDTEWIPIGSGTTLIHKDKFVQVNWKSYTKATRTLLTAAFSRRTLATHSLTGKKSPAFSHKPAKMCLDPKIVSDIVIEVGDRFQIRDNLVRNIITTKCADECKMRKLKKAKKQALKAKLEAANETNDVENNNDEDVPTPKKSPRSSKKNSRKSTPPKTRNTSITARNNKKKNEETEENVMPPENNDDDTNKTHPDEEEHLPPIENKTKSAQHKIEEDMLSSDDDTGMVIDEDYRPPSENSVLKTIDNNSQENILPAENNRRSLDGKEEHKPSVHMNMRSRNRESIPPPENNTSKSLKNKNQENIPPPVKKTVKGYKTYKNKCKTK